MENEKRGSIKISGAGSASGGIYDEVKISGAGDIDGDIECNLFKSSGASNVRGNLKAKELKVSGGAEIKGNLQAEEIRISGGATIRGDVNTNFIKVTGAATVKGSLHGEEMDVSGSVTIGSDCEVEHFKASGNFKIGGLLNADNVEVRIGGECTVKEIGGEKIEVRMGDGVGFVLNRILKEFLNLKERLITDVIEGDNIYLEGTSAKIVRGSNITIGADCDIELVEYKDQINVLQNAIVREQRQV